MLHQHKVVAVFAQAAAPLLGISFACWHESAAPSLSYAPVHKIQTLSRKLKSSFDCAHYFQPTSAWSMAELVKSLLILFRFCLEVCFDFDITSVIVSEKVHDPVPLDQIFWTTRWNHLEFSIQQDIRGDLSWVSHFTFNKNYILS